jgi:hypothetical protein
MRTSLKSKLNYLYSETSQQKNLLYDGVSFSCDDVCVGECSAESMHSFNNFHGKGNVRLPLIDQTGWGNVNDVDLHLRGPRFECRPS